MSTPNNNTAGIIPNVGGLSDLPPYPPFLSIVEPSGIVALSITVITLSLLIRNTFTIWLSKLPYLGSTTISNIKCKGMNNSAGVRKASFLRNLLISSILTLVFLTSVAIRDFNPFLAINGGFGITSALCSIMANCMVVFTCKEKQTVLAIAKLLPSQPLWPHFAAICFCLLSVYVVASAYVYNGVTQLKLALTISTYSNPLWYFIIMICDAYLNIRLLLLVHDTMEGTILMNGLGRQGIIGRIFYAFHITNADPISRSRRKTSNFRSVWRLAVISILCDLTFLLISVFAISMKNQDVLKMALNLIGYSGLAFHMISSGEFAYCISELTNPDTVNIGISSSIRDDVKIASYIKSEVVPGVSKIQELAKKKEAILTTISDE